METKKEIRQRFLEKRSKMPAQEIKHASEIITQKIINLPEFKNAKNIMCYYSVGKEVCTHELINYALENNKKISVPKVLNGFGDMEAYLITSKKDLILNSKFGIWEPDVNICKKQDLSELELIIAPGVAFDKRFNRLGRGRGCYDKFLAAAPSSAFKLGVCYVAQIYEDVLPVSDMDVRMDFVVTERVNTIKN